MISKIKERVFSYLKKDEISLNLSRLSSFPKNEFDFNKIQNAKENQIIHSNNDHLLIKKLLW